MEILLVIIGLIAIFYGLKHYLSLPKVHKVAHNNLRKFFEILLYRGYDGGFLIIEGDKKIPFLQFKKYISDNDVYLEMSFPKVKWSMDYFPSLKKLLSNKDIHFEIKNTTDSNIDFLDIHCSKDIDFCVSLTNDIFVNIFNNSEETLDYKIKFFDVSPLDEKIGFE